MREIALFGKCRLRRLCWVLGVAVVAAPIAAPAADEPPATKSRSAAPAAVKAPVVEKDDPAKFFLFYKGDLSPEQVRADLVYCIGQAKPILSLRDQTPEAGGLLGALLNGRMADIDRFRMRNAAMRKCMGLMGYERYAVAQQFWRTTVKNGDIVQDDNGLVDAEVVERMVSFATGPTPTTGRLQP